MKRGSNKIDSNSGAGIEEAPDRCKAFNDLLIELNIQKRKVLLDELMIGLDYLFGKNFKKDPGSTIKTRFARTKGRQWNDFYIFLQGKGSIKYIKIDDGQQTFVFQFDDVLAEFEMMVNDYKTNHAEDIPPIFKSSFRDTWISDGIKSLRNYLAKKNLFGDPTSDDRRVNILTYRLLSLHGVLSRTPKYYKNTKAKVKDENRMNSFILKHL